MLFAENYILLKKDVQYVFRNTTGGEKITRNQNYFFQSVFPMKDMVNNKTSRSYELR
jgi:hypothetical protein